MSMVIPATEGGPPDIPQWLQNPTSVSSLRHYYPATLIWLETNV